MKISEWLDEKEADGFDLSHLTLPEELSYDEPPDETIFFEEFNPCGILCTKDHPFSKWISFFRFPKIKHFLWKKQVFSQILF